MRFGEPLPHGRHRLAFALFALGSINLLTARRALAAAAGEVALGCHPVVVELHIGILDQCHADGRALIFTDYARREPITT